MVDYKTNTHMIEIEDSLKQAELMGSDKVVMDVIQMIFIRARVMQMAEYIDRLNAQITYLKEEKKKWMEVTSLTDGSSNANLPSEHQA